MLDFDVAAEGLEFPEGPIAMADGSVLLVEVKRQTLSRVKPDKTVEVLAFLGGGPNGAAIGPDGAIYICNNGGRFDYVDQDGLTMPAGLPAGHKGGSIQRVDIAGKVTTLYDHCDGRVLLAPNDIVFDRDGGFWFTDYGTDNGETACHGALCYARADGSFIVRAAKLPTPNGVGLSPDGRVVYVSDTMTGRLWAFDIIGRGAVAPGPLPIMPGRLIATLPGFQLLDSLAVEQDGRVSVGTIVNGGITTFSTDGSSEHVQVPDLIVTNICFGGPDMRHAWITASGSGRLLRAKWPRAGLSLAFNA